MLKVLTAHTNEIDDPAIAVAEIVEQLDFKGKLLSNTLGLISCYAEYIDTGVIKALSEALPFEIIGTTTLASFVKGSKGILSLTLTVLTSDDVFFTVGLSDEITSDENIPIEKAYLDALSRLGEKPKLMFSFAPLLTNVGGDSFAAAWDKVTGGIPNFGTIAVDHTANYGLSQVIYQGQAYQSRYVFSLVAGNVNPSFFIATLPPDKVGRDKGIVTASAGNQLREVDGAPAMDFLKRIGLITEDGNLFRELNSFPIVIDYNDGSPPVVRVAFASTPEGYAICGGNFPVGSTISVGRIDEFDVINTTRDLINAAVSSRDFSYMMMFSCVGRYLCLGLDPMRESDVVREILDDAGIAYQLTYSGGELCPTEDKKVLTNHNHNDTYIICAI